MNPTFYQREKAAEAYQDDHPSATWDEAIDAIDELFKDFIEEHA